MAARRRKRCKGAAEDAALASALSVLVVHIPVELLGLQSFSNSGDFIHRREAKHRHPRFLPVLGAVFEVGLPGSRQSNSRCVGRSDLSDVISGRFTVFKRVEVQNCNRIGSGPRNDQHSRRACISSTGESYRSRQGKDRSFHKALEEAGGEGWLYLEQQQHGLSMSLLLLLKAVALFTLLPTSTSAADLNDLYRTLLRHGFTIEESQPPGKAYGRFIPSERRLEISPLVRDLGIARSVFLHEAVHAAQSCPNGDLSLIGVQRTADPAVNSRIQYLLRTHYETINFALEQEAFVIQGQPDAEQIIITALNMRCVP